ncbi:hypothetical protein DRO38_05545 [Candidatus Bathyarchaeota archaeon]|nr:MAG: hypothetical protein DRO38_05545 [Candidatus Bathyarchaeota archaeon]
MIRFWTIDALIEQAALGVRDGNRMDMKDFMHDLSNKMLFARNAGDGFLNGNSGNTIKAIMEALRDSCNDKCNGNTRMHEVVEMSKLLRILGNQTIQCTLKAKGAPQVSYIVKTTKTGIEYIKTVLGKQDNATINLDIDLDLMISDINDGAGTIQQIRPYTQMLMSSKNTMQAVNTIRLFAALGTEAVSSMISRRMNNSDG